LRRHAPSAFAMCRLLATCSIAGIAAAQFHPRRGTLWAGRDVQAALSSARSARGATRRATAGRPNQRVGLCSRGGPRRRTMTAVLAGHRRQLPPRPFPRPPSFPARTPTEQRAGVRSQAARGPRFHPSPRGGRISRSARAPSRGSCRRGRGRSRNTAPPAGPPCRRGRAGSGWHGRYPG